MSTNVGDEGGFAPALGSNEEAIEVVLEAIKLLGIHQVKIFGLLLDAASSEFFDKKTGKYTFESTGDVMDSK